MNRINLFVPLAIAAVAFCGNAMAGKTLSSKNAKGACNAAFLAGSSSSSVGQVMEATETCEKATQKVCEKNSDGTGDGRYLTAACGLSAAYGSNKAVNESKATPQCESAYKTAMESPSTGDVMEAIDVCNKDREAACAKQVNESSDGIETGDGRLVNAACGLTGAHGAYVAVTTKEAPAPKASPAKPAKKHRAQAPAPISPRMPHPPPSSLDRISEKKGAL